MGWIDGKGLSDDARRTPGILEQVDGIERGERPRPDNGILEQAERAMRGLPSREPGGVLAHAEKELGQRQTAWELPLARPPVLDKGTRGRESLMRRVDDDGGTGALWEFFDPDEPEFSQHVAVRLTEFLKEGLVSTEELDQYLREAYATNCIPSRRWFRERQAMDWLRCRMIDGELAAEFLQGRDAEGFRLPVGPQELRVVKCRQLLERLRDYMDRWVEQGCPVTSGSRFERYLAVSGAIEKARGQAAPCLSDIEAGKTWHEAVWKAIRPSVEHAILTAKAREAVKLDAMVLDGLDYAGANFSPWGRGYTVNFAHVAVGETSDLIFTMVHEPQHDAARYGVGHQADTEWSKLYEMGDWGEKLQRALAEILNLLANMPAEGRGGDAPADNQWQSLLRKCCLEE